MNNFQAESRLNVLHKKGLENTSSETLMKWKTVFSALLILHFIWNNEINNFMPLKMILDFPLLRAPFQIFVPSTDLHNPCKLLADKWYIHFSLVTSAPLVMGMWGQGKKRKGYVEIELVPGGLGQYCREVYWPYAHWKHDILEAPYNYCNIYAEDVDFPKCISRTIVIF